MGTRLYVAGSESFLGSAVQVALKYDLNARRGAVRALRQRRAARLLRPLQGVERERHDQHREVRRAAAGTSSSATTTRAGLAAYMGVMADAEAPGELPPIEEVFA